MSCTYYWSEKPAFFFQFTSKVEFVYIARIGTGIKKFVCLHLKWSTRTQKASLKSEKLKKTENFIERFRQKVDGSYVNNRTKIRPKNSETFKLQKVLLSKRYCAVKSSYLKRIYFYEALCMNKYSLIQKYRCRASKR